MVITELNRASAPGHPDGGELTISYESLTWEGLLGFLSRSTTTVAVTITVPAECPIQLGVLSASAVVSACAPGRR